MQIILLITAKKYLKKLCVEQNVISEAEVQRIANAEIGPVSKVAEDEEYDEVISLYDFIDEQAVRGYEGLEQSTLAAAQQSSVYAGLAETQTADTSDSTEHVDDADNNDQDQVSKPTLSSLSFSSLRCHVNC